MGVRLYDDALVEKLKKWIRDPKLRILKPNEVKRLFEVKAEDNNDKPLTLPLISIARDPSVGLDVAHKRSLSCDGLRLDGNDKTTVQLDAIPININYQIDIYTQKFDEGDEYLRNFIFNIVNHPKLTISIPYNDINIQHYAYLKLQPELTDNSDIAERFFPDQFTRWSIRIAITDAFLFSVPVRTNKQLIGVELKVRDVQPGDDTITVEYNAEEEE